MAAHRSTCLRTGGFGDHGTTRFGDRRSGWPSLTGLTGCWLPNSRRSASLYLLCIFFCSLLVPPRQKIGGSRRRAYLRSLASCFFCDSYDRCSGCRLSGFSLHSNVLGRASLTPSIGLPFETNLAGWCSIACVDTPRIHIARTAGSYCNRQHLGIARAGGRDGHETALARNSLP